MFDRRLKIGIFSLIFTLGIIGGASFIASEIASAQSEGSNGIFLPIISNMVAEDVSTDPISLADLIDIQEVDADQEISPDEGGSTGDDEITALGAYGIEYWNAVSTSILGIPLYIPGGQLAHLIEGNGNRIDTDGANFASIGTLCDTSMRFTYGNGSHKLDGNVHWGCSKVGQWKYRLNWDAPRGNACAELWAKDWSKKVATQCHYIHGQTSIPTPTPRPTATPRPNSNPSTPSICSSRPTLKYGDGYASWGLAWKQGNVRQLQQLLTSKGFYVAADGHFGNGTKAVVQRFQSYRGLSADGIVGYNTWSRLCY